MAKVLISSLGTGVRGDSGYKKAKYKIGYKDKKDLENLDNNIYETSFIADALRKHYKVDKIFFVGTKKSIWDEVYLAFGGKDEKYWDELYEKKEKGKITLKDLEKLNNTLGNDSKCFLIDYGLDEQDLWSNFEVFLEIEKYIQNDDEILLDITHSFRSLSLVSFVMSQFASTISNKKFNIFGVYYGMFEYSYESPNKITPVVDIKFLFEMQEWIKAINAIKKYSDFNLLIELIEKDSDIEKSVKNTFKQLNDSLKMLNLGAIEIFVKNLSKKINLVSNSSNKIVKLLAPEISELIEEIYDEKKSHFQYKLAKWFFKNKNYAFSYIALYEAIISKSCELKNYEVNDHDLREKAKKDIGDFRFGQFFYTKPGNKEYENSISNIRNSIVHQNNKRQNIASEDINRLEKYLKTFEKYIFN